MEKKLKETLKRRHVCKADGFKIPTEKLEQNNLTNLRKADTQMETKLQKLHQRRQGLQSRQVQKNLTEKQNQSDLTNQTES